MKCPKCGAEAVCDEVDIGVGTMTSPAWCNNCGWQQSTDIEAMMKDFGISDEVASEVESDIEL